MTEVLSSFLSALMMQAGYNAALVGVGASLLGAAAGSTGTFLFLRKRSLISDASAHATLPGIALAFMVMVSLGGDGRSLPGLLLGSALSAGLGLLAVTLLTRYTRLAEDTAIGAVLSVFFGFGIVLLTVIQVMGTGRQAGLEGFLLGSTAGMLFSDAVLIACGGAICVLVMLIFRRPMLHVCFDPGHAETIGIRTGLADGVMLGLMLAVTVTGLKLVGLVLIVALLIIPAATARFWSERATVILALAALFGALAGYVGSALSAAAPNVPAGPVIVLTAAVFFTASLLAAPRRGLVAAVLARARQRRRLLLRQGVLTLAQQGVIHDPRLLQALSRAGLLAADRKLNDEGRALAQMLAQDEARWAALQAGGASEDVMSRYDGVRLISSLLSAGELAQLDRHAAASSGELRHGV
ncbi:Manganese transport system membrane protein mntB [Pannonibacter phragmitetus]|uniref:Manganese transport system membrane protein mntB n=1 Tax=Pannonibacter phragmitetus TaxID=121719 RepID=A0A378ZZU0_9HYPH|nr:metal ABC transporter permease [Pannonibacter phragmitetus]SUB02483.1 Manganese transport system membrane protein mntB [Pannonibacter phragmitetus]